MILVCLAPVAMELVTAPPIVQAWAEQPQDHVLQDLECAACVS
mgnify:FL=1